MGTINPIILVVFHVAIDMAVVTIGLIIYDMIKHR